MDLSQDQQYFNGGAGKGTKLSTGSILGTTKLRIVPCTLEQTICYPSQLQQWSRGVVKHMICTTWHVTVSMRASWWQ